MYSDHWYFPIPKYRNSAQNKRCFHFEMRQRPYFDAVARWPGLSGRRLVHETIRRMIDALALDLITQTRSNIAESGVQTLNDVRAAPTLVEYSGEMWPKLRSLKTFLFDNLYRHERVLSMSGKAQRIIVDLFAAYMAEPDLLPPQHRARVDRSGTESGKARAVADYIAGMTDRYAMKKHRQLHGESEANDLRENDLQ
jgi:dGTPase